MPALQVDENKYTLKNEIRNYELPCKQLDAFYNSTHTIWYSNTLDIPIDFFVSMSAFHLTKILQLRNRKKKKKNRNKVKETLGNKEEYERSKLHSYT